MRWLVLLLLSAVPAAAQTDAGLTYGLIPSVNQWNGYFSAKTDYPLKSYTVATLPTCATALKGAMLMVTDATTPTYNAALTGGGAVVVPVFCDGSAWTSH